MTADPVLAETRPVAPTVLFAAREEAPPFFLASPSVLRGSDGSGSFDILTGFFRSFASWAGFGGGSAAGVSAGRSTPTGTSLSSAPFSASMPSAVSVTATVASFMSIRSGATGVRSGGARVLAAALSVAAPGIDCTDSSEAMDAVATAVSTASSISVSRSSMLTASVGAGIAPGVHSTQ